MLCFIVFKIPDDGQIPETQLGFLDIRMQDDGQSAESR
jgi:hypothetical protein